MLIVILAAALIGGAAIGILLLLRLGIAQEETRNSLLVTPPTSVAAITRWALGFHARGAKRALNGNCTGVDPRTAPDMTVPF
jgi:hypothetical protein